MKKYAGLLLLIGAGVLGYFLLKKKKPVTGDMTAKEAGEVGESGGGGGGSMPEDMSEDFERFQEEIGGDSFSDPTGGDFGTGELGGGSGGGGGSTGSGTPPVLYPSGFGLPETNLVNVINPPAESAYTRYLPGQAPWELTDVRQVQAETSLNPKVVSTTKGTTVVKPTATPVKPKVEIKTTSIHPAKTGGTLSTKPKAKPVTVKTTKRVSTVKKKSGRALKFDGQSEILN